MRLIPLRRSITGFVGALALLAGIAVLPVPRAEAAPPTPPPPVDPDCGTPAPSLNPMTPDEQTLSTYFGALNAQDYATAWSLFNEQLQYMFGSQQQYAKLMAAHVSCVRLLGVQPHGPHTYLVFLAEQYIKPFPAGSGTLPTFWTLDNGLIAGIGTSPPSEGNAPDGNAPGQGGLPG
ncbi:MAG: hypothetical protein E6Q56_00320 [Mycobacterium sp.]|nr:MAG: hypothetical protein E6Q56_00320 [Mycobacterium sp.]